MIALICGVLKNETKKERQAKKQPLDCREQTDGHQRGGGGGGAVGDGANSTLILMGAG